MKFVFLNIDAVIMVISIIATVLYTQRLSSAGTFPVRPFAVFLFLFGPVLIFFNMLAHNAEIAYNNIEKALNGTFSYNYRLYSLIFMGVVFALISGYMINEIKQWSQGQQHAKTNFIKASVLMIVLSLPTVFFTPIGSLPTMACLISLTAMAFAKRHGIVQEKIMVQ